jgi:hypothetical protein
MPISSAQTTGHFDACSCAGGAPDHSFETAPQSTPRSSASVHTFQKSGSADCGRCASGNSSTSTRTGIGAAQPRRTACLEGKLGNSRRSPPTLSGTRRATRFWSASLTMRCNRNVLHWASTVGESSDGRCDESTSPSPYLRPSRAMRRGSNRKTRSVRLCGASAKRTGVEISRRRIHCRSRNRAAIMEMGICPGGEGRDRATGDQS